MWHLAKWTRDFQGKPQKNPKKSGSENSHTLSLQIIQYLKYFLHIIADHSLSPNQITIQTADKQINKY